MTVQMLIEKAQQLVPAQLEDRDAVVAFFGALHHYNASLDPDFTLSDGWEKISMSSSVPCITTQIGCGFWRRKAITPSDC